MHNVSVVGLLPEHLQWLFACSQVRQPLWHPAHTHRNINTKTMHCKPDQARSNQIKPDQTRSSQIKPDQTRSKSSQIKPTNSIVYCVYYHLSQRVVFKFPTLIINLNRKQLQGLTVSMETKSLLK